MSFNKKIVDDAIYDALNHASITALLVDGADSIYHQRAPRNVTGSVSTELYPMLVYYQWDDFMPQYVLDGGRSHITGSYRITCFTKNDPQAAADIAEQIDLRLTNTTNFAPSPYTNYNVRCKRMISRVIEHDDTVLYHESGGIYLVGVSL